MKKIFAFAIALVAMATSMVSCNNDNAEFIEQKAPTSATVQKENTQEMKDVCLLVAVAPEQKNYYDEIYIVQMPGETQTVMVSEMEPATKEQIAAFAAVTELNDAFKEIGAPAQLEYYSFKLNKANAAPSSKILSHKLEAKANHPAENFNFVNAAGIYFNGQIVSSKADIRLFPDIHGNDDEVKNFANVLNQYN